MPGFARRYQYDVAQLEQLWAAGASHCEIAAALGVHEGYVKTLKTRHKLPSRNPPEIDPTPEEIAERAAECRARHLEAMRAKKHGKKAVALYRSEPPGIRLYTRDDFPSDLD